MVVDGSPSPATATRTPSSRANTRATASTTRKATATQPLIQSTENCEGQSGIEELRNEVRIEAPLCFSVLMLVV